MANEYKFVSTALLITILLGLVFAAGGLVVKDTRDGVISSLAKIEVLQKDKLDREQYYRDMGDIKETLKNMDTKLDNLRVPYRQKVKEAKE